MHFYFYMEYINKSFVLLNILEINKKFVLKIDANYLLILKKII